MPSFSDFNISEALQKATRLLSYHSPTAIQQMVIPIALEKRDIIAQSRTGSGKTAAFAIPICEGIDWEQNKPQALVIVPTRELAMQVKEDIFHIGRFKRIKVAAVFGKSPMDRQQKELKQKTHVVVGTPGRLIDHIERGTLDLSGVSYLVIDEADEMLNMGFIEQIETIIKDIQKSRHTMLFSATMPKDIEQLCKDYMNNPQMIAIEEGTSVKDRIIQHRYITEENEKLSLLDDVMIMENPDSCIIFCNTQTKADEVYRHLSSRAGTARKIHGGMEQRDRMQVMQDFKRGDFRYLVATDVAARGIDIDNISLVINYDIPKDKEKYVHRIGRTGRVDKEGKAITFAGNTEKKYVNGIEQCIGKKIDVMQRPSKSELVEAQKAFDNKNSEAPKVKEAKGAQLSVDIMKLHISAGKKTKMRPVDIVGTLCSIEGMSAADIGIINIADISTFVEILNNKGELVYEALQTMPIKGRLRRVSKKILEN